MAAQRWRQEFDPQKRTLWIDGASTSLKLEVLYWLALERIAAVRRRPWRELAVAAIKAKPTKFSSTAGWLRIWIFAEYLRYRHRGIKVPDTLPPPRRY